jgi:hypothetical protein
MPILLQVARPIAAPAEAVFALALDAQRFPATFRGCGPIPGLVRITPHAPAAVGSTRDVESSDGSVLVERITALEPPRRHSYTLNGLRPPLAWLVRAGHAEWTFEPQSAGSLVTWRYTFETTHALAWPLAWPLLQLFMRTAMQRCLAAMAFELEAR